MKKQDLLNVLNYLVEMSIEFTYNWNSDGETMEEYLRCLACGEKVQGHNKNFLRHKHSCNYRVAVGLIEELSQKEELIPIVIAERLNVSRYSPYAENDVKFKIYGDTGVLREGILNIRKDSLSDTPFITQVITLDDGSKKEITFYVYDCVEELYLIKLFRCVVE